nr:hypothetical protein [Tanacetum cinerariifolium]
MNSPYVRRMILEPVDYNQIYNFLKYNQKEIDDLRAERLAKRHGPLALMENSNNPYNYPVSHPDQLRMIHEPGDADRKGPVSETFHEKIDEELTEKELKQMVGGNGGNQFRQYAGQNVWN